MGNQDPDLKKIFKLETQIQKVKKEIRKIYEKEPVKVAKLTALQAKLEELKKLLRKAEIAYLNKNKDKGFDF